MSVTILVVDDTDLLRQQMVRTIAGADLDLEVVEAKDGAEALPLALSGDVDIVLSDIVMPSLDGIGLLRAIRQEHDPESLPVILVTSLDDHDTRGTSFEVGASDYLSRPFASSELVMRIQVQLRLITLQRELNRANESHKKGSTEDDLTGLPNRKQFMEHCRREMSRCRRHKLSMSVAMIDIDGLQKLNVRAGNRAGDALIRSMADLIRRRLRGTDIPACLEGGRFSILFTHSDGHQARTVCERLCESVVQTSFSGFETGDVAVSIGQASYPGGEIESVEELVNGALAALDTAKEQGGNRLSTWSGESKS